jgi:hypothetical protein
MHNARFNQDENRNIPEEFIQAIVEVGKELVGPGAELLDQFKEQAMHVLSDKELYDQLNGAIENLLFVLLRYLDASNPGDGSWIELWMASVHNLGGDSYTHSIYSRVTWADGKVQEYRPIYVYKSVWWEENQAGKLLYDIIGGSKDNDGRGSK